MTRKLIQLSPSTSVVSLPSKWIQKNRLSKGTELIVEENENKIIISTLSKKSEHEITLDLTNLSDRLLWAYADAAYIAGYDKITLITKDQKQTNEISKISKHEPGMIIEEEREKKLILKDITGDNREDIDKILNRIFNMNIAMIEDSIAAIKSKDYETLVSMKKRDWSINGYINYCLRQINKFGYTKFSKSGLVSTYLKIIEILSDKIVSCLTVIGTNKNKIDIKYFEKINQIFKQIQRLHQSFSKEKLIELEKTRHDLLTVAKNLDSELEPHFSEICRIIYDLEEVEIQLQI